MPEIYDHRRGGVDARWSVVCRGTERMCKDWIDAVAEIGVVVEDEDEDLDDEPHARLGAKGERREEGDVTESSSSSSSSSGTSSGMSSMVDSSSGSEDEGGGGVMGRFSPGARAVVRVEDDEEEELW